MFKQLFGIIEDIVLDSVYMYEHVDSHEDICILCEQVPGGFVRWTVRYCHVLDANSIEVEWIDQEMETIHTMSAVELTEDTIGWDNAIQ